MLQEALAVLWLTVGVSPSATATLDLERLVKDVDVKSLQENVMNVAFCDIEREVSKPLLQFEISTNAPILNAKFTVYVYSSGLNCLCR